MVACPLVVSERSLPVAHRHVLSHGGRGRQLEFGHDVEWHDRIIPERHLNADRVGVRRLPDYA
eukprot:8671373-Lingulodinium_polyedra.AAC.1